MILSECPTCHVKQALKNKFCKCGEDLDKAKRSKRVKFWIKYRLPDGKQKKESVNGMEGLDGYSLADAKTALSKRQVQKAENRILEVLPDSKMTFEELAKWYLKLEKVKALKSFWLVELCLKKFNDEFGDRVVNSVKLADLENFQAKRLKAGKAPATVDHEIGKAKTVIIKAFENDLVGGDVLKTFSRCKKTLKPGSDIRDRILNQDEFDNLLSHSNRHLSGILKTAYYTGMRRGEILGLTWDKVDMNGRAIRLTADMTKDSEARTVPICDALYDALKAIPRAIHDTHVFLYRGKPVTHIRNGLRRACKKAGIGYGRFVQGGFIFHDLRHTFNTNMRKAGVAESVIMAITGHSTREMFDRYNRVDGDDTATAINQLEGFLQNGPQMGPQKAVQ